MILTPDSLKWPQIDAAFKYIYDNPSIYRYENRKQLGKTLIIDCYEFGVCNGGSTKKICDYITKNVLTGYSSWVHGFDSFEGLPDEAEGVSKFEKFEKGSYKSRYTPEEIKKSTEYAFAKIHKVWFNKLDISYIGLPALFVHIDCDLYVSTKDALNFLWKHNLIQTNTLIAYDEFESTNNPELSGERKAHELYFGKDKPYQADEIWHNIYYDKSTGQRIRQSVFEVIS